MICSESFRVVGSSGSLGSGGLVLRSHSFSCSQFSFVLYIHFCCKLGVAGIIIAFQSLGRSRPTKLLFSFLCILYLNALAGLGITWAFENQSGRSTSTPASRTSNPPASHS